MRDIPTLISIHALREEGDTANPDRGASIILFLSTPSARRATSAARSELPRVLYFYPRPPRGGRRSLSLQGALWQIISIHALREEGDETLANYRQVNEISIHALREEGDAGSSAAKEST